MTASRPADAYVLDLAAVDATQLAVVGGKGAHLGELGRVPGVHVPAGFCVTTAAYRRAVATPAVGALLDRLDAVPAGDAAAVAAQADELRRHVAALAMPDDVAAAIVAGLAALGDGTSCAVRSSATAEDLPTASFAGQHDTSLHVVGADAVLRHVARCWASLFADRAVAYRQRNGIDHRRVEMAVVVQRMLAPDASGVLFTADPVTSNRTIAAVEAVPGLGEALVAGTADADVYRVLGDAILERTIATKRVAVRAAPGGGTREEAVDPVHRLDPVLTDAQVLSIVGLGRRIEAHAGCPQDIEWCLVDGTVHVVQSRPITTLFPVPAATDEGRHVYVSVGHQQMMTDPMRPLGLSVWQLTAMRPMPDAGGRLFVDVTDALASPAGREALVDMLGRADPLLGDALRTLLDRGDVVATRPDEPGAPPPPPPLGGSGDLETDPAIVDELIARTRASVDELRDAIRTRSGPALFDFVLADIQELKRVLFEPLSNQAVMAGMEATWWLDEHVAEWLGERNVADVLSQSAPNNVTSEMGLALLDVADAIRPHPAVVAFLEQAGDDDGFLDRLPELDGGRPAHDAIAGFLDRYGMRCVGEIDITRPRWSERPSALLPALVGNVQHFEPGEAARRFARGVREATAAREALLARIRELPDGAARAAETSRVIERLRTFVGYREHPKYGIVCRYAEYKRALRREAERLVADGALRTVDDMSYLTFQELHEVARGGPVDHGLIAERMDAFRSFGALTPPRVLTSDGEVVTGAYRRDDLPPGALAGLAVSAGTVEGRARVVLDMAQATLEPGDILVTAFTDPSWTPVFVTVAGLVTEVGGLMTHGAVIAREYGLPAVVGVPDATRRIPDGARVRVHGTDGFVEVLAER